MGGIGMVNYRVKRHGRTNVCAVRPHPVQSAGEGFTVRGKTTHARRSHYQRLNPTAVCCTRLTTSTLTQPPQPTPPHRSGEGRARALDAAGPSDPDHHGPTSMSLEQMPDGHGRRERAGRGRDASSRMVRGDSAGVDWTRPGTIAMRFGRCPAAARGLGGGRRGAGGGCAR